MSHMKDLFTVSIAGIMLWWVAMWPIESKAVDIYQDLDGRTWVRVLTF